MFERLPSNWMLSIKSIGYWFWLPPRIGHPPERLLGIEQPRMIVLALFPPLWRAVMNPRARAYYAGEEHQLTNSQLT